MVALTRSQSRATLLVLGLEKTRKKGINRRASGAAPSTSTTRTTCLTTTNASETTLKKNSGTQELPLVKDASTVPATTVGILTTPSDITAPDPAAPKGYTKRGQPRKRIKKRCSICRSLNHTGTGCKLYVVATGRHKNLNNIDGTPTIIEKSDAVEFGVEDLNNEIFLSVSGVEMDHSDPRDGVQIVGHQETAHLNYTLPFGREPEEGGGLAGAIDNFTGETFGVESAGIFSYVGLLEADDPLRYLEEFDQVPPYLSHLQEYVRTRSDTSQGQGNPEFLTLEEMEEIAAAEMQEI